MLALINTDWVILAIALGIPAFVLTVVVVGMRVKRMVGLVAAVCLMAAVGLGFGVAVAFRPPPSVRGGGSAAGGSGGGTPSPTCSPSGTTLTESAKGALYGLSCLAAPAGTTFTIAFDNEDSGNSHSIHIYTADPAKGGTSVFQGEIFAGPATKTYDVQALKAGTYYFHCDVHPTTMIGTLVVG
jgi:plastocyanin